jgi:acyl-CoA thioester hydrolase
MPAIYEHRLVVQDDEIDLLGHVYNLRYLQWMIDAAVAHSAAQGWGNEDYLRIGQGWVVRAHEIEYLAPAHAGEPIAVRTWIADFKRVTSRRRYRVVRETDGRTLAEGATNWAFIDFATRRLIRIPDIVSASFEVVGETP